MNILIISSHPWHVGGAKSHVQTLAKGLMERGHRVIFVADSQSDQISEDLFTNYFTLPFRTANPHNLYLVYRGLKSILQNYNIDIIHAQQRTAAYFSFILWKDMRVPFVVTLHDDWRRTPLKSAHGSLFPNFIAVSRSIRDTLLEQFKVPASNIEVIYNGVDAAPYCDKSILTERAIQFRKWYKLHANEKVITLVGRVSEKKGHFDLINALTKVKASVKCVFVGDGDIEQVRAYADSKGIADKVIFTGYSSDVPTALAASDIVVLPSHKEAFGLVIIEGMLAMKPVIATTVGGIPEIIMHRENGLLVAPHDITGLASSIDELLNNKQLYDRLVANGKMTALANFTADTMIEKTIAHYNKLISESSR